MKRALLLIDIQKDYFPGGRMEVAGAVDASLAAKRLLEHFRAKALPVVHIQHIAARPNATFLLPHTVGIEIHENVSPVPGEQAVVKHFPNSFRNTDLDEHFRTLEVTDLIVCGMMSHMCIDATTRAAFDKGYTCVVAHDACATRNLMFNNAEIPAAHVHGSYMAALGAVYAKILSADEIIGML
ncbi:MAG: cysteine hydrolase [Nitrospirota bacterium]|nr:cysteine hydrolase [Nitrospirota bacterium]